MKKREVKYKLNRLRLYLNLLALGFQMVTILKLIKRDRDLDGGHRAK